MDLTSFVIILLIGLALWSTKSYPKIKSIQEKDNSEAKTDSKLRQIIGKSVNSKYFQFSTFIVLFIIIVKFAAQLFAANPRTIELINKVFVVSLVATLILFTIIAIKNAKYNYK